MKKSLFSFFFSLFVMSIFFSQQIEQMAPTHWWTGMKYNQIEILVHAQDIAQGKISMKPDKNVDFNGIKKVENSNYIFIQLGIHENAQPTTLEFKVKGKKKYKFNFEIKSRTTQHNYGIDASDVIYLITPDRFANGNYDNDAFPDMQETIIDRDSIVARHGGDLQGVIQKLDYIKDLGITATWLNPVNENDQHFQSYHGYGITDQYKVDKRFGGNEVYRDYVNQSHQKGLKVVNDVVYNHIGAKHYLWQDIPAKDWFHLKSGNNYRATTLIDPYVAQADKDKQQKGWFSDDMPDFNQDNEHVANYLIQHALWWVEEFGVDAYRVDTYAYSPPQFTSRLAEKIETEFPGFTIFAEVWVTGEPTQAWFTKGKRMDTKIDSHISGITDFELQYAMIDACNENFGWNTGIMKIYYTLAFDYLYDEPMANVIFLDNHDINRFLGSVNNNVSCLKMNTAFLLTTRGIPQYYYGTEILMNQDGHHGNIRTDFPGGWKGDKLDKFTTQGRTDKENDYFDYVKTLMNWRKTATAIHSGKLTQFIPEDNVYVYFRTDENQKIMVVMNASKEEKWITTERYKEVIQNYTKGENVITNEILNLNKLNLAPQSTLVLELK